jgi:hypothetical protein
LPGNLRAFIPDRLSNLCSCPGAENTTYILINKCIHETICKKGYSRKKLQREDFINEWKNNSGWIHTIHTKVKKKK